MDVENENNQPKGPQMRSDIQKGYENQIPNTQRLELSRGSHIFVKELLSQTDNVLPIVFGDVLAVFGLSVYLSIYQTKLSASKHARKKNLARR